MVPGSWVGYTLLWPHATAGLRVGQTFMITFFLVAREQRKSLHGLGEKVTLGHGFVGHRSISWMCQLLLAAVRC